MSQSFLPIQLLIQDIQILTWCRLSNYELTTSSCAIWACQLATEFGRASIIDVVLVVLNALLTSIRNQAIMIKEGTHIGLGF